MDDERFQQMEKRLNEQAEATQALNETLNKFIAIMGNQEVARNIAPPPPVSTPLVITPLQASQPSRVKPGIPVTLMEIERKGMPSSHPVSCIFCSQHWILLTSRCASIGPYPTSRGGRTASFTKCILQQELRSGKMCFTSWSDFTEEFASMFCLENKATTALIRLKYDCYFQGKQNVEAYINEFKDLIDLSGYTDPIVIMLKFRQGLNPATQDRIAESGMDRLSDMDFNGWFKAAQCLDLNRLANEAFYLASRCPHSDSAPTPTMYLAPLRMPFSFLRSHVPTAATPAAMHTPSRALPPGIPMDIDRTWTLKPLTQTCYRCGQTSHTSRECNLHHDVCHMTLDEQDNFIHQIMANRNTAVAATAGSTTHMGTSEGTLVEREVNNMDVVRSSR
jgi:hypothetical protein